jgi:hypothetical protein
MFGDMDASGGLTRARLAHACRDMADEVSFQSRFDLFCRLGMLRPAGEPRPQRARAVGGRFNHRGGRHTAEAVRDALIIVLG